MATAYRRTLGTLLSVVVLLAACMPAARPQALAPAAAPAQTPVVTEAEIPALIDQLDDPNWLIAHQAAEALSTLGEAGAQALRSEIEKTVTQIIQGNNDEDQLYIYMAVLLRTLEQMPREGSSVLKGILLQQESVQLLYRALSAWGLSRMGKLGHDALVAAIEGKQVVAIGAAPLLGEQALPALRAVAADGALADDTRREVLAALVALGEPAYADQVTFFDTAPEHQSMLIADVVSRAAAANPLLRHIAGGLYPDDIRTAAAAALGDTALDPDASIPLLLESVQDAQLPLALRRAALGALGGYGTQAAAAIPLLEELLAASGDPLQAPAAMALGRIGLGRSEVVAQLTAQLAHCDPGVNELAVAAAQALGSMGPLAQPATEALLDVFDTCEDETTLVAAAAALGQVAPATPAVVDALSAQLTAATTHSGSPVTEAAATALGQLGPAALPALATALTKLPEEAKDHIATALTHMGPVAAPALIDALLQPDADAATQQAAASALVGIGSRALPFIIEALSNDDIAERQRLVDALYGFGAQALGALHIARNEGFSLDRTKLHEIKWCIAAGSASDADTASSCIMAAADVLPTLIAAILPSTAPSATLPADHRESAIQALALLGPAAAPAAPLLGQVLAEKDVELQCAAAQALQEMGASAVLAGPAAAQAFAHADATASCGDVSLPQQLIDTLGGMGPDAEFAIPQLMAALAKPALRRHAAEALGAIGGAAHAPLLTALHGAEMDNESADQRRAAAYALHESSTVWGPALAAQVTALAQNESENRYVRAMLAAGLAEQGYPLDGIWTQLDLPNPAAQVCWNWPAIYNRGGVMVLGYDLYRDTCLLAPKPGADLIEKLISWLADTFG